MGGLTVLVLAVPLAAFLSGAALPKGRPALLGIGGALALGLGLRAVLGPGGEEPDLLRPLIALALTGLAMAAAAQGLRLLLPATGPLARAGYPAILLGVLALTPALARALLN